MNDEVKIKLYIDTGFAGVVHEDELCVSREEWDSMDEAEREEYLETAAQEFLQNKIDFGAYVEEEN